MPALKAFCQYLYANSIRAVMAEFYSTPLNNKMWESLSGREGLDAEEKETYKRLKRLMNSRFQSIR